MTCKKISNCREKLSMICGCPPNFNWICKLFTNFCRHVETPRASGDDEDDDVEREKQRVLSGRATEDTIRIENLTKVYHTSRGPMTAVDRMCVGIPRGEVS